MGLPALVDALRQDASETGFGVWRQNWDIVLAFLTIATQWRAIALGMTGQVYWMGLDYAAVRVALDARGIAVTPALWSGLCVMERAARDALNGVKA